ncbi:J domain-containing protein [Inhella gelatinilytica]|uniref:J domain-containing protein n=1 Tax=Inhella gelatinilytica TaxID=2795030 RepID=A0A931ITE4_9BURK|nr:J domain-containing protein [Inhella gelatinilytica]MBH9551784.1 J domain-containing protein [Inhella gelatinilytica]
MARLLTIPQPHNAVLTPAQRKFNQLQKQIDSARQKLAAWDAAVPPFAAAFAQQVLPLRAEALQLRREVALQLDAWLAEPKAWTQGEREVMRDIACDIAFEALEGHDLPEAERARWTALHDRHADRELEAEQAAHLEALKAMLAEQTGLDLEGEAFADPQELFQHVRARLQDERDEEEALAAERKAKRKPTAAQARRAAEQEAIKTQAQKSLREVFRKLASALHPDRAPDEEEATRRTALMQRVNAAYAAEDLLALLSLQLEVEQIDAQHLKGASEAQLKHFNAVLQEQLEELQGEVHQRAVQFCAQFQLNPERQPDPARLSPLMNQAQAAWRAEVYLANRDLQSLYDRALTKRWIKRVRAEARPQG